MATPHDQLIAELLDSRIPKTEREHAAAREIERLREALAEPEQQPIAVVTSQTGDPSMTMSWHHEPALPIGTKLYTSPPTRKPLTDERIDQIIASNVTITDRNLYGAVYMAIREVEAAHGIGGEE
jgi:hypothetical protein